MTATARPRRPPARRTPRPVAGRRPAPVRPAPVDRPAGWLSGLGAFLSQAFVVTGALFYFGWVRTDAAFRYYGIDISLLSFSSPDYVLRSGNAVFSLVVVAAAILVITAGGDELVAHLSAQRSGPWLIAVTVTTAVAALGLGAVLVRDVVPGGVYAVVVVTSLLVTLLARTLPRRGLRLPALLRGGTVALTVALLFMAVGVQASQVGTEKAAAFERTVPDLPRLRILSEDRLPVADGDGVTTAPVRLPGSRYRFETVGFRLLIASGPNYYLVRPVNPRRAVLVLPSSGLVVESDRAAGPAPTMLG